MKQLPLFQSIATIRGARPSPRRWRWVALFANSERAYLHAYSIGDACWGAGKLASLIGTVRVAVWKAKEQVPNGK